jgi:hypothetical protein
MTDVFTRLAEQEIRWVVAVRATGVQVGAHTPRVAAGVMSGSRRRAFSRSAPGVTPLTPR